MFSILDGDWLEERPGCPGLQREAPTARLCPPSSPRFPQRPPPGSAPLPTTGGAALGADPDLPSLLENSRRRDSGLGWWARGCKDACRNFSKCPEAPAWGWGLSLWFRRPLCRDRPPAWSLCPGASCLLCHWAPTRPGWASPGWPGARSLPHSLPGGGQPLPAPCARAAPCGGPPCPQQCSCAKELVPSQHAVLNLTNLPTKLNRGGRS